LAKVSMQIIFLTLFHVPVQGSSKNGGLKEFSFQI